MKSNVYILGLSNNQTVLSVMISHITANDYQAIMMPTQVVQMFYIDCSVLSLNSAALSNDFTRNLILI